MEKGFKVTRRKFLKYTGFLGLTSVFPFYSFGILKTSKNSPIRFGVITDSHFADRVSKGTRFYRDSLPKLQQCITYLNTQNLDFLIHLGDFKDEAEKANEVTTLQFLKTYENEFSKFKGKRYHVLGNHDMDSISKEQFLRNIENTDIESAKSYYYYENKGMRFIVLDANFKEDGTPYHKGNFDWKDTNIPQSQLFWLKQVLAESKKPCMVFVHQMLDDFEFGKYGIKNAKEVREILEKSKKVIAVFQGHKHQETYHHINGIHYYTFNAMVDYKGLENNSFSVVTIKNNLDIKIEGYYRSSNKTLTNK
jgi:alkaline phosphatase